MGRRTILPALPLLVFLLSGAGCEVPRRYAHTPDPAENVAVIRATQIANANGAFRGSHGFLIARLDGKRTKHYCHEVRVEPGHHTLDVYYFRSTSNRLPPSHISATTHWGPITIELDTKAGSTYTITGDETRHEIIEDSVSSSAE